MCPICGSESDFMLKAKDHHYNNVGEWNLNRCKNKNCAHMFQNPIPSESELINYYGNSYYAHNKPQIDYETSFMPPKNIGVYLHKAYLKHYKGYNHINIGNNKIFGFLGKLLTDFSPSFNFPYYIDGGILLDYGSGSGDSVGFAKHIGWKAEGIEFNKEAAQVGQDARLNIKHGSINILSERSEYYDYIITSHCVEHVPDVKKLFNGFFNALKYGGKLLIDIPNGDALSFKKYKEYYYYLGLPVHVNIFSVKSIRLLAENTGFKINSISSYNKVITQAYSLELIDREKNNKLSTKTLSYKKLGYLKSIYFILCAFFFSYSGGKNNYGDCLIIEFEK